MVSDGLQVGVCCASVGFFESGLMILRKRVTGRGGLYTNGMQRLGVMAET